MKAIHIRAVCARPSRRTNSVRRVAITAAHRREILAKTEGRCHVCGDRAGKRWQADHANRQRLLAVSHTDEGDIIRIISAWAATRPERRLYEEG